MVWDYKRFYFFLNGAVSVLRAGWSGVTIWQGKRFCYSQKYPIRLRSSPSLSFNEQWDYSQIMYRPGHHADHWHPCRDGWRKDGAITLRLLLAFMTWKKKAPHPCTLLGAFVKFHKAMLASSCLSFLPSAELPKGKTRLLLNGCS